MHPGQEHPPPATPEATGLSPVPGALHSGLEPFSRDGEARGVGLFSGIPRTSRDHWVGAAGQVQAAGREAGSPPTPQPRAGGPRGPVTLPGAPLPAGQPALESSFIGRRLRLRALLERDRGAAADRDRGVERLQEGGQDAVEEAHAALHAVQGEAAGAAVERHAERAVLAAVQHRLRVVVPHGEAERVPLQAPRVGAAAQQVDDVAARAAAGRGAAAVGDAQAHPRVGHLGLPVVAALRQAARAQHLRPLLEAAGTGPPRRGAPGGCPGSAPSGPP